jgi:glycosyltransferase involved in cell wall biosynthesis
VHTITHILYSGLGGHASVAFSYLQGRFLDAYDHHLLFFGTEEVVPEYRVFCEERGIAYSFVRKTPLPGLGYLISIVGTLRRTTPSVVIVHSLPTVPLAILHGVSSRVPIILVEHASVALKRPIDIVWTLLAHLFAQRIVYLTHLAVRESKTRFRFFVNPKKCGVIPNGIDLIRFSPSAHVGTSTMWLATHCRLVPVKDLATLIRGVSLLKGRLGPKLTIAGDGPSKESLMALVVELGLEDDVTFAGRLTEKGVIDLLQNADIYLNTSTIETMSTSLMQAMASGLPCIASDIQANLDMIEDGVNGSSFSVSDPEDLAVKIEDLWTRPDRGRSLGESARAWARGHFSNQSMVDRYHDLVGEIL